MNRGSLLAWVGLSIAVGLFARSRGKSFLGYTLGSLILSPPVCLILLLIKLSAGRR